MLLPQLWTLILWAAYFGNTFSESVQSPIRGTKTTKTDLLTVCVFVEEDSYYTTYPRLAAAIDLSVKHTNEYILPRSIQLQAKYRSTGNSCSQAQYAATAAAYDLMHVDGVKCDVFFGASCPTTAAGLYGIAQSQNLLFLGAPAAGVDSLSLTENTDNSDFSLIIEVSFEFGDLADFITQLFKKYSYRHAAFIRDDALGYFTLLARGILRRFKSNDEGLYNGCTEIPFNSLKTTGTDDYRKYLIEADGRARVIALLMHAHILRDMMIIAHDLGFTNGEHVFFAVELYDLKYWGKIHYSAGTENDTVAKNAFQSLLIFSLHLNSGSGYTEDFAATIKEQSHRLYNYTFNPIERLDPVITGTYNGFQIYGLEIMNLLRDNSSDYRNGSLLSARITDTPYDTSLEHVRIGTDGQRDMDYDVKSFDKVEGAFDIAMSYMQHLPNTNETFRMVRPLHWPNHQPGEMPPDEPPCGFKDDKCKSDHLPPGTMGAAIAVPLLFIMVVGTAGGFLFMRFWKMHTEYNPNWWKIVSEEVVIKQNRTGSTSTSKKTITSRSTAGTSNLTGYSGYMVDILGMYKGTLVMLTEVKDMDRHVTPELVTQVGLLKGISHPNLQTFIGITLTPQNVCEFVVSEVCSKGSLTEILDNEMFKLDWSFKNSLIRDIVYGMTQIHTSPIVSHGNLNSHICFIDARFTLKIADYGLPYFRKAKLLQPPKLTADQEDLANSEIYLWRAPELLRTVMPPQGTQRGDVYSFAIVLQQIILRSGPFELPSEPLEISNQEIIKEVINSNVPPVRPRVPRASCSNELYDLMERCWEEIPLERPTFPKVKLRLVKVIGNVSDNIVDVLFKRMEQYAADLELKVAEKTQQFMDEKNRSSQLLGQLLPQSVAAALMRGEHVDPEAYESVTIYFSDIVGFTTISAAGSPMDVVSLLNALYTFFDGVLEKYDVYKVETIGDAYMVSSGLPVRNGNKHASEISLMSLTLVKGIVDLKVPNRPIQLLEVRIGINSGPCVAGIVGMKMPRYCLFGDTVNVASRMESTGEPMKIQISLSTKILLDNIGGFHIVERGPVPVKGKGILTTYWLLGTAA
ncbi:Atrial natriuretic peptide receptor 1 [Hypsibius exemplaris]|uniref:Guanylate cyclase n=1 Tax=Hypsibius exemplaris TaxID=2072580 RepID=A0A1W0WEL3_HYPEX|nr:Atrial natriuretic peptide receptor 1 [Hypsibius exemplaris]